ncbi:InlB B-repeat-containing protein, partial [Cohnella terricola]
MDRRFESTKKNITRRIAAVVIATMMLLQGWFPSQAYAAAGNGPNIFTVVTAKFNSPTGVGGVAVAGNTVFYTQHHSNFNGCIKSNAAFFNGQCGGGANNAEFISPQAMIASNDGRYLYVVDSYPRNQVKRINLSTEQVSLVAGNGTTAYSGDGGPATSAGLNPRAIALDSLGNLYIAEFEGHRIRKVDIDSNGNIGNISTVAGNGSDSVSIPVDGVDAISTPIAYPQAIALVGNDLYIVAGITYNTRLYKVSGGKIFNEWDIISTVSGLAADSAGNIYVTNNHRILKRDTNGNISNIAGTFNSPGTDGDNGPAVDAKLSNPTHIAINESNGKVKIYFTEAGTKSVRVIQEGYKVTYNKNETGGADEISNIYDLDDSVSAQVSSFIKAGHTFDSWNTQADGLGVTYKPGDALPKETATLYAQWTVDSYTLTYTAGSNGIIDGQLSQNVTYGANGGTVTAIPNPGYGFAGWSDGKAEATRTDLNVTSGLSVTANFAPVYTVSFDSNGGSAVQDVNVIENRQVAAPTATREGHTFVGWYKDLASTTPFNFSTAITANTSLIAKWDINSYTLTYIAGTNGSISGNQTQTVTYGSDGTEVTAVPNTGFGFAGWNDGKTEATRTDLNVSNHLNVTANFGPINTVSFDSNGGSAVQPLSVVENTFATAPTEPTLDGFTFAGWYTDTGLKDRFDFATTPITGSITLYAKWTMLPPGAPALQSAIPGDGTVTIQWTSVAHADDYQVFMSSTSGNYDPQSAVSVTGSVYSYQATGL